MIDRLLSYVPRVLASKAHIAWLFFLLLWIVFAAAVFPGIASARVELILGNYTNVTSDIGACIAAGGTVHLVRKSRQRDEHIKSLHDKIDRLSDGR